MRSYKQSLIRETPNKENNSKEQQAAISNNRTKENPTSNKKHDI
jgi:hypothetical protein